MRLAENGLSRRGFRTKALLGDAEARERHHEDEGDEDVEPGKRDWNPPGENREVAGCAHGAEDDLVPGRERQRCWHRRDEADERGHRQRRVAIHQRVVASDAKTEEGGPGGGNRSRVRLPVPRCDIRHGGDHELEGVDGEIRHQPSRKVVQLDRERAAEEGRHHRHGERQALQGQPLSAPPPPLAPHGCSATFLRIAILSLVRGWASLSECRSGNRVPKAHAVSSRVSRSARPVLCGPGGR